MRWDKKVLTEAPDKLGLIESDYPHADSNWPETQSHFARQFKDIPNTEVEAMAWRNAAQLFRMEVPKSVVDDPNAPWPCE